MATTTATKKAAAKKTTAKETTPRTGAADAPAQRIEIRRVQTETLLVPILGTRPLVVHNFSEKSKRQMLEAQQGRKSPKEHRDPESEYQSGFYWIEKGDEQQGIEPRYGFPAIAFKAATISGARFYGKAVRMTEVRQFLFFRGLMTPNDPQELVEIDGTPEMREDVVRLGGVSRSADLRYRPSFNEWSTMLEVTYVKTALSQDSVLSLIEAGGLGVGVGEWRPEKNGTFGTYKIDDARDVQIVPR